MTFPGTSDGEPWSAEPSPFGDEMLATHFWENCPHGCPEEDCVGHLENPPYWLVGPEWVEADEFQFFSKSAAERIVACVNALAGICNPAALAELISAAKYVVLTGEGISELNDAIDALGGGS